MASLTELVLWGSCQWSEKSYNPYGGPTAAIAVAGSIEDIAAVP